MLTTLDYIDTLNFADRIGAPTLLSAGLSDDVGPPETAYALYNLAVSRDIRSYPDTGHEGGGLLHLLVKQTWLAAHLVPERGSVAQAVLSQG